MDLAIQAAHQAQAPVYTLGPLIHNPQVVEYLKSLEVGVIDDLEAVETGTVIIRSHGVPAQVTERARERGLQIVDATCPYVKRCMQWAKRLHEGGYRVVIIGERDHPEVVAVRSRAGEDAMVVGDPQDAARLPAVEKMGVVAQTTQSLSNLQECIFQLVAKANQIKLYNTICTATALRQAAAVELAKQVDVMLVVGGRNSANTRRLADLCSRAGTDTYHIETKDEIRPEWFVKAGRVGITAGASTPTWLIEEVVQRMSELNRDLQEDKDLEVQNVSEKNGDPQTENENTVAQAQTPGGVAEEQQDAEPKQAEATEQPEDTAAEEVAEEQGEPAGETAEQAEGAATETEPAAKEEMSEQELRMAQYDETFVTLHPGQIVEGKVVKVSPDEVLVDIGYKSEGVIPANEMGLAPGQTPEDVVEQGQDIDVYVLKVEDAEGSVLLSKRRADAARTWRELQRIYENDEFIEAKVKERVKGGLLVDVGVRAFVPASHVDRYYVEDLDKYVGEALRFKIIELDKRRNNVVLSRKKAIEDEHAEAKARAFASLEEGQIIEGIVRRITDFGAFVDIGDGVEGLLHVSEMAWSRVRHPSDVVSEGEKIKVMILRLDEEKERISLGLKQTLPDPWEDIDSKYEVGDVVTGEVTRVVDFGAFVKLEDGVEGLVHISQLADRHVENPSEVVSAGDEVAVKIVSLDLDRKRIGLSIKAVEQEARPSTGKGQQRGGREPKKEPTDGPVTIGDMYGDNLSEILNSLRESEDN